MSNSPHLMPRFKTRFKPTLRGLRNWLHALLRPLPLVNLPALLRYVHDYRRLKRQAGGLSMPLADTYPCLEDRTAATPFDAHYFYQGAWLARQLAQRAPARHVDISSSVLTISVLSAFVPTTFLDFRPLAVSLPGLTCLAGNVVALELADRSVGSLSCLHVIEHIGLGRYGDPLDALGHERAARELARVLAPHGRLYLTLPVGRERVCFNAHRVLAPATVLRLFPSLHLETFAFVDDQNRYHPDALPAAATGLEYGCGMFVFSA